VRIKNKGGLTALQCSKEFECSRLLLEKVAKSPPEKRKLFLRWEQQTVEGIRTFLREFPDDVEVANDDAGDTLLILASRANKIDLVKCLMDEFGASVNNPNKAHSSPLMAAAMRGYDEIVKYLIPKGADIDQRTKNLDAPTSLAVWKNHTSTVKLLINAGANVTGIDNFGDSMLHDASKNGNEELVKFFLSRQIDIDRQNKEGLSPLHRAAEFGHAAIVKILLGVGARWDSKDNQGRSPLQITQNQECRNLISEQVRKKEQEDASKAATLQAALAKGVQTSGGGGGGGGGMTAQQLAPLIDMIVQAMNKQTDEIVKLRQSVEAMKK